MSFNKSFADFLAKRTASKGEMKRPRSESGDLSEAILHQNPAADAADATDAANNPINTARIKEGEQSPPGDPSFPHTTHVVLVSGDEEGDEEDLRMLLGGNSIFVPSREAAANQPPAATARGSGGSRSDAVPLESTSADTLPLALADFPWSTATGDMLRMLAWRFDGQLLWELHCNEKLLNIYEPFFSDRAINAVKKAVNGPQFLHAAELTMEMTKVPLGYSLRPYQFEGVQFLLRCFHRGMSCILGDDMGLGKTAQIVSFLGALKKLYGIDGPHLIVAPLSTITSWTRELSRWAPALRVLKYHGVQEMRSGLRQNHANKHSVFVTTPSVFNQDRRFFRKRPWVVAVMDEAHILKGSKTIISYAARKITACFRIAVTGTPVHNKVEEVWNLMGFLYPLQCVGPVSSDNGSTSAAQDCINLLQHVMLRRTKTSIELGIPERKDNPVIMVQPTRLQRRLLSRMSNQLLTDDESNNSFLQRHLVYQRVVCSHPLGLRLLALEGRVSSSLGCEGRLKEAGISLDEASVIAPSSKMIELDRLLRELKEKGHRCLIFTNFTCVLDMLQALFLVRGYSFERLDGSTSRVERELAMVRFNSPRSTCFAFLLSTTAGGVGITLTGADTVIFFDSHYNPQMDRQAADRAHRIGQERTVNVFRLCCSDTVEQRIHDMAQRKASLGDFIVDGVMKEEQEQEECAVEPTLAKNICSLFGTPGSVKLVSGDGTASGFPSLKGEALEVGTCDQAVDVRDEATNESDADASHTDTDLAQEDAMIDELLNLDGGHLEAIKLVRAGTRAQRSAVRTSHNCYVCDDIMRPLMPLYHCSLCPKAYHAECINERPLVNGATAPPRWVCPRHNCFSCGAAQSVECALFLCTTCTVSYCFDCLDAKYFELDENGSQFVHISSTYNGMEEDGVEERRILYYLTCLRCCGILSSSCSSCDSDCESSGESEDESDENGEEGTKNVD
ncbi:putative helicase-like protein [Trypanosoma vivax]|nr:putative helicase-like protein [Trypanosoma vivax]